MDAICKKYDFKSMFLSFVSVFLSLTIAITSVSADKWSNLSVSATNKIYYGSNFTNVFSVNVPNVGTARGLCTQPGSSTPYSVNLSTAGKGDSPSTAPPDVKALICWYAAYMSGDTDYSGPFNALAKKYGTHGTVLAHLYVAYKRGNGWDVGAGGIANAITNGDFGRLIGTLASESSFAEYWNRATIYQSNNPGQDLFMMTIGPRNNIPDDRPYEEPKEDHYIRVNIDKTFTSRDSNAPYGWYDETAKFAIYVDGSIKDYVTLSDYNDSASFNYNIGTDSYANVRVEEIDTGRHYEADSSSLSRRVDADSSETFRFTNRAERYPVGNLEIEKRSSNSSISRLSSYNMSGTTFRVRKDGGGYDETHTLYQDGGTLRITNIPVGRYTVSEVSSGTNYRADSDSKSVYVSEGSTSYLTGSDAFVNTPILSDFRLYKVGEGGYDKLNNYSLAHAKFKLTSQNDSSISYDLETNERGEASVNNIPLGNYTLTEVSAPKNYNIDSNSVTVNVNGSSSSYRFMDTPLTTVPGNITKEGIDGKVPEGDSDLEATFKLTYFSNNSISESDMTDNNADFSFKFKTKPKDGKYVFDYKASDAFGFSSKDTMSLSDITIGGVIKLPIGKYQIREIESPKGYLISDEKFTFEVNGRSSVDGHVFKDKAIRGGVKIEKVDSETETTMPQGNAKLKATFDIINKSKNPVIYDGKSVNPNDVIVSITTDDESKIAQLPANALPYGTYEVREKSTDDSYKLSEDNKVFKIEEDGKIVNLTGSKAFENEVKKGKVSVLKYTADLKNDKTSGDGTLEGAEFSIINRSTNSVFYKGREVEPNKEVAKITTNEKGLAETEDGVLSIGKYEISETKAPDGYELNTTWKKTFEITPSELNVSYRDIADETVDPSSKEAIGDKAIRGGVEVMKVDSETKNITPQGNAKLKATFDIINRSKQSVEFGGKDIAPGEIVTSITTDDNTMVAKTGESDLAYGTYEIKEVSTDDTYYINDTPKIFKIKEARKMEKLVGINAFENNVKKGKLSVQKYTSDFKESNPSGNGTLKGAEFSIVNKSNHSVFYKGREVEPNKEVTKITTNEAGLAETGDDDLAIGKYEVKEITAPEGYRLNTSWVKTFEITPTVLNVSYNTIEDEKNDSTSKEAIGDETIKGGFKLQKFDFDSLNSNGESTKPQGEASLKDAEFYIVNESNHKVKIDGKVYNKGEKVMTLKTDANGQIITANNVFPYGTYSVKEEKAPAGYFVNSEWTGHFTIKEDGKIEDVSSSSNNPVADKIFKGDVKILKIDKEKGINEPTGLATLKGAEFTVYNNSANKVFYNGKWIGKDEAMVVITTNDQGYASTTGKPLPYGKYYIKETKPSEGYHINSEWRADFNIDADSKVVDLTETNKVPEEVIKADVQIKKGDRYGLCHFLGDKFEGREDSIPKMKEYVGEAEGNATLKGAEFEIINRNASFVVVDGKRYEPGQVVYKLITDDKGFARTHNKLLPYGSYEIKEVKAPEGYNVLKYWEHRFNIDGRSIPDNDTVLDLSIGMTHKTAVPYLMADEPKESEEKFHKIDSETKKNSPQGDATLENATYSIYNESKLPIYYNKTLAFKLRDPSSPALLPNPDNYEKVEVKGKVYDILTNNIGDMITRGKLPYGTYRIVESKPSEGYLLNSTYSYTFKVTGDDTIEAVDGINTSGEQIIRGGVEVVKYDKELNKSEALGGKNHTLSDGTNLLGIKYQVINKSKNPVMVDGKEIAPGKVCLEMTTKYDSSKKAYVANTANNALPYGTYLVKEVSTNPTYLLTNQEFTFKIRNNGEMVKKDENSHDMIFKNQVVRGDLSFKKLASDTNAPLVTGWIITNLTTGEEHVLLTDKEGNALTSRNKHSVNTNVNDKFIALARANKVVNLAKDGDFNAGIWFGKGEDGSMAKVDDALSALPYGKYHADEIKSVSNTRYDLRDFDFFVHENGKATTIVDDGKNGVINNKIEIKTTAVDEKTKTKLGVVEEKATIIDTVHYKWLRKDRKYRVDGILYDKETNAPFLIDGKPVKGSTTFVGTGREGDVKVKFVFNSKYAIGKSLVVFESLYDLGYTEDLLIATHEDINDRGQTIDYPEISTFIKNDELDHLGSRSTVSSTKDEVKINNLYSDSKFKYVLDMSFIDKATGEVFTVDNKELKYQKVITSETIKDAKLNTVVDMPINVENYSRDEYDKYFAGKTLVSVCKLSVYEESNGAKVGDDIYIHSHDDLADENETIHFPKIVTKAYNSITKLNMIGEDGYISDSIKYYNLIPGHEYEVTSRLYDKTKGEFFDEVKKIFTPEFSDGELLISDFNEKEIAKNHKGSDITVVTYLAAKSKDADKIKDEAEAKPEEVNGVVDAENSGEEEVVNEPMKYFDVISHNVVYDDESETVMVPEIKTNAFYGDTNNKEGLGIKDGKIRDLITYKNLDPTKTYTIKTRLLDTDTDAFITSKTGIYEFTKEFKPEAKNGEVLVEMNVDLSKLRGKSFTVYEKIYYDGLLIGSHEERSDKTQTINIPDVGTKLFDFDSNLKETMAKSEVTLRDEVRVSNIRYNSKYKIVGTIINKETGKILEGSKSSELIFTTGDYKLSKEDVEKFEKEFEKVEDKSKENHDKMLEEYKKELESKATYTEVIKHLNFDVDLTNMAGKDVVAFEKLYYIDENGEEFEVGNHEDIEDKDQTVTVPDIKTTLTNDTTGDKRLDLMGVVKLTDKVRYTNLIPGQKYKLKAYLMDKDEDGYYLDKDGNKVYGETEFRALEKDGYVNVEFIFNGDIKGKTLVAFEKLYNVTVVGDTTDKPETKETLVGRHEDIDDNEQSVYGMSIRTVATGVDKESKVVDQNTDVVIYDKIEYKNLVVGKKYRVLAKLHRKSNKSVIAYGKTEFVPDNKDGEVYVRMVVDTTDYGGEDLVVTERIFDENDNLIGEHIDYDDSDQTVTVEEYVVADTGISKNTKLVLGLGLITLVLASTLGLYYHKSHKE